MSGEPGQSKLRKRRWWLRRWHRLLGVVFALPLLWLAVSGLLLRHAADLGLHESKVRSGWVLKRYGVIPEGAARGTEVGSRKVEEWGENLFLDGVLLEESGVLVGAVGKGRDVVVATEDYLLICDSGGMLVDQLGEESLPGVPIGAIGTDGDGGVMVRVGGKVTRIADDFFGHAEIPDAKVTWSVVTDLVGGGRDALEARLAGQAGVSWHRVLLDMHSGNLFGALSQWAVDIVAIGIIALTVMGIGIVFRKPRRGPSSPDG